MQKEKHSVFFACFWVSSILPFGCVTSSHTEAGWPNWCSVSLELDKSAFTTQLWQVSSHGFLLHFLSFISGRCNSHLVLGLCFSRNRRGPFLCWKHSLMWTKQYLAVAFTYTFENAYACRKSLTEEWNEFELTSSGPPESQSLEASLLPKRWCASFADLQNSARCFENTIRSISLHFCTTSLCQWKGGNCQRDFISPFSYIPSGTKVWHI